MSDAVKRYREIMGKKKELQNSLEELRKEYKNVVKEAFADEAKVLFDQFPAMESFGWNQYTPHWNDGDTCYFSAHTSDPYVNGEYYYDMENPDDELVAAVQKFLQGYDEDTLKDSFGDHVMITVRRAGEGVETVVEDYDHD
jgi:hypothetical protein